MTKHIATGCLRVKEKPSSAGQLTYIFKNDFFEILEASEDGLWLKVLVTGGVEGWISKSNWFKPVPQEDIAKMVDPPWLKIALDERKKGVAEISGPGANPRIVEYLKTTRLPPAAAESDETHWCSAFVNWCFEQCGIKGIGSPAAQSWLGFGDRMVTPCKGCVVVFNRPPDPFSGHVAFYIGDAPGKHGGDIAVLGGNQGDAITIATYPRKRLLGFRWPSKEDYPDNG
jgi:uncharacterized protein (TIGR02594 family)